MSQQEEMNRKWSKLVARAWSDPQLKKELLSNPEKVLREQGLMPKEFANKRIKMVENTPDTLYLILPAKPSGSLSQEELRKVAGAGGGGIEVLFH